MHDKAFTIAKNLKYHAYQHGLIDMHDVFSGIKNDNISNKELAEKLHKQIIKKSLKKKVHSSL